MQLKDEQIKEFQAIYKKQYGKELPWDEAVEAARSLLNYVKLCYDLYRKDEARKRKLADNPKGFHLEGEGYTCFICGNHCSNEQAWYDKYGIKCMTCQAAINKRKIPATTAKFRDKWYSEYEIKDRFCLNHHALKRLVKEEILKPRIVPSENGGTHCQIFLIKDNKETLPLKKLTDSHLVKETKDGKDWYYSEPWYRLVGSLEAVKGYKIMDYLRVVNENKT